LITTFFKFSHFALKKIGVVKKPTKGKSRRPVSHLPREPRKNTAPQRRDPPPKSPTENDNHEIKKGITPNLHLNPTLRAREDDFLKPIPSFPPAIFYTHPHFFYTRPKFSTPAGISFTPIPISSRREGCDPGRSVRNAPPLRPSPHASPARLLPHNLLHHHHHHLPPRMTMLAIPCALWFHSGRHSASPRPLHGSTMARNG
jgi:hypothetical protein